MCEHLILFNYQKDLFLKKKNFWEVKLGKWKEGGAGRKTVICKLV